MPSDDGTQFLKHEDLRYNGWRQAEKVITFAGGTTNAIGDYDGTGDPFDIFTVTGTVIAKVIGICETDLAGGSATLQVGVDVSGQYGKLIAQTTATDIDAGDLWHDATPDSSAELSSVMAENIVANSKDIVGEVGTANITSGVIRFICLWKPISKDGEVVAA